MYGGGSGNGQAFMGVNKPTHQEAGAPMANWNANGQYPQAEVNYSPIEGPSVEGTPLYTDAGVNPAQAAKLSRFRLQGFKDVWAAILFIPFALFPIVWGILQLITYPIESVPSQSPSSDKKVIRLDFHWIFWTCLAAVGASIISSSVILKVAQRFPIQIIYIGNIASIIFLLVSATVAFLRINIVMGFVLLVVGIFRAIWFFLARNRIPFAAALLKTSLRIINAFKFTYVLSFILGAVSCGYVILWGYGVLALIDRFQKGTGNGGYIAAMFLLVFSVLWVSQVIPNVMHVTTCGLVATWYFAGFANMPRNPTLASFKRATTTSFGTICFGSLVVAIVEFLRFLLSQGESGNEDNFLRCLGDCLLGCLQHILEMFNKYAFVHVAIYGCSYIEGAKRTFKLCQQCFCAGLFNECLVSPTLTMLALTLSILYALIVGVFTKSWPLGVLVFVISVTVHWLFFSVVDSAVATVFVCFAEAPEALRESDPQLYDTIYATDTNGTNNNAPPPI
ncbi:hypothetical protein JKF63_00216 [Porcisia hertigi]|uniref:Choline transporter-like protein n=1 Tax=Porcisia hertigi TaxID=2761500 RepID=A0A836HPL2_9TRYP|nr:hypothetical protein JKF63_00216 [Porcisia hertigi]